MATKRDSLPQAASSTDLYFLTARASGLYSSGLLVREVRLLPLLSKSDRTSVNSPYLRKYAFRVPHTGHDSMSGIPEHASRS
jgi:hypothetical protein